VLNDDRIDTIRHLINEHNKSPSLRHIRDPYAISKLASDIVRSLDRSAKVWQKWEGAREHLARAAAPCWIPIEDLLEELNRLPGGRLTMTDVEQRLLAIMEEALQNCPSDELREGCLALYATEKAMGTEMAAIIGAIRALIDNEEERLRNEKQQRWRAEQAEERRMRIALFRAGADCPWTTVDGSKELYRRINGRTYRATPTADKLWLLHRIQSVDDPEPMQIGKYKRRGDINKLLATMAYEDEPRWM
jgi:hypothetical protein